jgi:hypothetical protein
MVDGRILVQTSTLVIEDVAAILADARKAAATIAARAGV